MLRATKFTGESRVAPPHTCTLNMSSSSNEWLAVQHSDFCGSLRAKMVLQPSNKYTYVPYKHRYRPSKEDHTPVFSIVSSCTPIHEKKRRPSDWLHGSGDLLFLPAISTLVEQVLQDLKTLRFSTAHGIWNVARKTPHIKEHIPWQFWVGRCNSYWTSSFLRDSRWVFRGKTLHPKTKKMLPSKTRWLS